MTVNQELKIYTVGHGSRKLPDFLYLLKESKISVMVDVRSVPYSRFHEQYRRRELAIALTSNGIKYIYMGNTLGGRPANPGLYLNGKLDYSLVRSRKDFQSSIQDLVRLVNSGIKVALMCSESDPNQCHRKHLLADEFEVEGIEVRHINKVGNLERHSSNFNQSLFD